MAIISNLLSIAQPSGAWISIIRAFEAVTNNYVLAIIFLTVVIRLIWAIVDTFSKYSQQKMNAVQASIQPEIEKVKAKYANQPQILSQKQNEIYRKHMGKSYYGGCLIMLIVMVLNLVIFFTLFSGLNTMASFKISENYDNLKYTYANCLNVVDNYFDGNYQDRVKQEIFKDYQNLEFEINVDENGYKTIALVHYANEEKQYIAGPIEYKESFEMDNPNYIPPAEGETSDQSPTITSNEYIVTLINKIFPVETEGEASQEIILIENNPVLDENGQQVIDENGNPVTENIYLSGAVQNVAMRTIVKVYDQNKESFLWIDNIWIADSPTTQSIMSYSSIESSLGRDYVQEGEEEIYNAFMEDLKAERSRVNGYYILPVIIILTSFLSMYLINLHQKKRNRKAGKEIKTAGAAKWMQIIMPIILGIFALFYNSVFAIYMLTGQVVSAILTPLQYLIIDKIIESKNKKKEEKVVVDYTRKF